MACAGSCSASPSARSGRPATTGTTRSTGHLLELARRAASPRRPRAAAARRRWLEPLGPFVGDGVGPPPGLTVNDASLVLRLAWVAARCCSPATWRPTARASCPGRRPPAARSAADVLKVPHHGSRTSSSDELIEAVGPRACSDLAGLAKSFSLSGAGGRRALRGARPDAAHRPRRGHHRNTRSRAAVLDLCARAVVRQSNRAVRTLTMKRRAFDRARCRRCQLSPAGRDAAAAARASRCSRRASAPARGELDRAAGEFSLALEYEPRFAEAENGLGLVALALRRLGARRERASARPSRSTRTSPRRTTTSAARCTSTTTASKTRWSWRDGARRSILVTPDARLADGRVLLRLGRAARARWDLAKECAAEPRRAQAQAADGLVLARPRRPIAAQERIDAALFLDPELATAHRAAAELLERGGDSEAAGREIDLALAANPARSRTAWHARPSWRLRAASMRPPGRWPRWSRRRLVRRRCGS